MKSRTLAEHLAPSPPKRILALDGGGVRGIVTLAFLAKLEELLAEQHGSDATFVLSDYFDLIGGTSTGAIIAASLARGKRVADIIKLYKELAAAVFKRSWFRKGVFRAKFSRDGLERALKDEFGETTPLRDPSIRTGLMVTMKRLDTSSVWPISNNPSAKFFDCPENENWISNGDYLLWKVVRASTAAPHYFDWETLEVDWKGDRTATGRFVDGGVSTANNPSFQLLMMATLKGYRLCWPMGADNLLLVSIGTGLPTSDRSEVGLLDRIAAGHAGSALLSIMDDCNALIETMMQWASRSPTARRIDSEIGDLADDSLGPAPLVSYLRYNLILEKKWLREKLLFDSTPKDLRRLATMDEPGNMDELYDLAKRAAEKQIQASHLSTTFIVP